MSDSNEIINKLRQKILEIVSLTDSCKEENRLLKEENGKLNSRISEQELTINELNGKYNSISLAEAFAASPDDSREAKLKVNKIVREIDKCIALLNK